MARRQVNVYVLSNKSSLLSIRTKLLVEYVEFCLYKKGRLTRKTLLSFIDDIILVLEELKMEANIDEK